MEKRMNLRRHVNDDSVLRSACGTTKLDGLAKEKRRPQLRKKAVTNVQMGKPEWEIFILVVFDESKSLCI